MNKSSSKNTVRMVLVIILILAAALVAFFLLPRVYEKEEATTDIVMLRQNVTAGTKIDEKMLATAKIGSYGLSSSVITDSKDIIGKFATQDISTKDLLFPEKFSDTAPTGYVENETPDLELKNGEMLLTLELSSTAAGAAGKIVPGEVVNTAVYVLNDMSEYDLQEMVTYDENGNAVYPDAILFPEDLQGITVYRVRTADLAPMDENADTSGAAVNERIPVYITLVVTQAQADQLLEYSYRNVVHFIETEADPKL